MRKELKWEKVDGPMKTQKIQNIVRLMQEMSKAFRQEAAKRRFALKEMTKVVSNKLESK